jgi:MtN3 and saliva related transmembrane protein
MNYLIILGWTASTIAMISFLPQVIQTIKTKDTKSISLITYISFCSGVFLWTIYSILINDLPLMVTNSVIFAFSSIILGLKIKYK